MPKDCSIVASMLHNNNNRAVTTSQCGATIVPSLVVIPNHFVTMLLSSLIKSCCTYFSRDGSPICPHDIHRTRTRRLPNRNETFVDISRHLKTIQDICRHFVTLQDIFLVD